MCDDDASMTTRWAPPGPPDAFDVAGATCVVSWLVATRGGPWGGASGGRIEGVVGTPGNTMAMVMSDLTWGVDLMGLLVFKID